MGKLPDFVSCLLTAFVILGGLYALMAWIMHSHGSGSWYSAEEVYEDLIRSPIPAQVTDLQGGKKDSLQGYTAYLRFQAPSLSYVGFTRPTYERTDCSEVHVPSSLPTKPLRSRFTPEWTVPTDPTVCLRSVGLPHKVWNYVIHDKNWMYFVGNAD